MRKLLVALITGALVSGPLAGAAVADPFEDLQALECELQDKLGTNNVKECGFS